MTTINLTIEQRKLLDLHLQLVLRENKTTNLTRIIDWSKAQVLHVEDSLIGLPEIQSAPDGCYLDMGTGAGYPGIPVAIMTNRSTLLADSVGKKTKALDRMILELGISEWVATYNGRLEDLALSKKNEFAVITARALSSLPALLELASPLLMNNGLLVCYKAQKGFDELPHSKEIASQLGMEYVSLRSAVLSDGSTHREIVVFKKIGEPSIKLPRRVGLAQKKPL